MPPVDVIVGDIHGCRRELEHLLAEVGLRDEDWLVALGDVVDRGPDALGTWRLLRDRPNTVVVMGNHERAHAEGRGAADTREQLGDAYEAFVAWARGLPSLFRTERYLAVHAWFGPYDGLVPLVFGHSPVGKRPRWFGRALGLDTGVCHGGALSAVVVPGWRTFSVPARRNYTRDARIAATDPWR